MTDRIKQKENEALSKCYSVKNAAGYSEDAMRKMFQKGVEASNQWISVDNELPDILKYGISKNVILKISVFEEKHKNSYECCVEAFYDNVMDVWRFITPINNKNIQLKPICWRPINIE